MSSFLRSQGLRQKTRKS